MEAHFSDELLLLGNALRTPSFRFIVVAHNRRSVYLDIKDWLIERFGNSRDIQELSLNGKDSTAIRNAIHQLQKGILLIPDLDFLLREENAAQCIYFNQRRDFFARLDIAFICFIQPSSFHKVAHKMPDWWSLRSLELEFIRDTHDELLKGIMPQEDNSSPLSSLTISEKEEKLVSLHRQIEQTEPNNKLLLNKLNSQIGEIYFAQAEYDKALEAFLKSLELCLAIGDHKGQGTALNNISQIYKVRGNYDTALRYLEQGLAIQRQIADHLGEGRTLNNLATTLYAKGAYEGALHYLEQSLAIRQQIGDHLGEGIALNNISQIYTAKGDYDTALRYLEQSLTIQVQSGNRLGEGAILNNISQIYYIKGNYDTTLRYLEKSLDIQQRIGDIAGLATTLHNMGYLFWEQQQKAEQAVAYFVQAYQLLKQIGSPYAEAPESYLTTIYKAIGAARFEEIMAGLYPNKTR